MASARGMPEHLRKKLGIESSEEGHKRDKGTDAVARVAKFVLCLVLDNAFTILALPLGAAMALKLLVLHDSGELHRISSAALDWEVSLSVVALIAASTLLAVLYLRSVLLPAKTVYLVDYAVAVPPAEWALTRDALLEKARKTKSFTADQVEFMMKVLLHSGLGNVTYLPPGLTEDPPVASMADAKAEFNTICLSTVEGLLQQSRIRPADVGIVIVNCSLFSPTPSLTATIMSHFGMPPTTIGYNLSGMGCSAGVIAVDLARELLQNHPNTYALVVSTENVTQNMYMGRQKSMLIPNAIFRCGGAAMLMSNRWQDSWRAKYRLQHLVRTVDTRPRAYGCVMEMEDEDGFRGVKLSKELMKVAGNVLKANLTRLAPLVLPPSELVLAGVNLAAMSLLGPKKVAPYVPDFTKVFHHVCIHTGGRGVIDAIEEQMRFGRSVIEPSRASLFRFGNVSSASIWYVLAYIESYRGVRRGDKVWQLGFGSGFKCNSAVWVANRSIQEMHPAWADYMGPEAMYAELASCDKELWKVVEIAMDKRERQLAEAKARGEDVALLSTASSLTNSI